MHLMDEQHPKHLKNSENSTINNQTIQRLLEGLPNIMICIQVPDTCIKARGGSAHHLRPQNKKNGDIRPLEFIDWPTKLNKRAPGSLMDKEKRKTNQRSPMLTSPYLNTHKKEIKQPSQQTG